MNYLAHVYLSGTDEEIIIGNFIGDYVKGNNYNKYPPKIKKGIMLHRQIDYFTDHNPIVHRSMSLLLDVYHKYSGIIIDIFYDHFLINKWDQYSRIPLEEFKTKLHELLMRYQENIPTKVLKLIPSFIQNDWLHAYQTIEGIDRVLRNMSIRTTLPDKTEYAINVLRNHYESLENDFSEYFPKLIRFVEEKFNVPLVLHPNYEQREE
ncbi:MAG: DUF479 domain-containing protein [Bacteroidales bacterium]|nr:DUF479 domain-containing protein [Bacteroidales bacterium]